MSDWPTSSPPEKSIEQELSPSGETSSENKALAESPDASAEVSLPADQDPSVDANSETGAPRNKPVYAISVAADLVNMHPQTLRQYERRGLLQPQRDGKNRLYSQNDIDRILYIQQLTQDLGVNLAGVEEIARLQLELERQKQKMQSEIQRLHHQIATLEDRLDEEGTGDTLTGR